MKNKIAVVVLSASALSSWASSGQATTCTASSSPHGNLSGDKSYRVNWTSFNGITRFTQAEGVFAVIAAADTWNEQADGGYFRYRGNSSRTDLPQSKADCDAQGIDYSLVTVVRDGCIELPDGAQTFARCTDPATGKGTRFVVKINAQDGTFACNDELWSVGSIGLGEWDLQSVVTHELGHTLGLGHVQPGEFGVMKGGDITETGSTLINRDLYQWDRQCVNQISGRRNLSMYQRWVGGGAWGGEGLSVSGVVAPAGGVVKVPAGYFDWSTAWEAPTSPSGSCVNWRQGSTTHCIRSDTDGSQLWSAEHRDVLFREYENRKYVVYSQNTETPANSLYARFPLTYNYSEDLFATAPISGTLRYCLDGVTCSSVDTLYTGEPLAVGWDDYNNRSLVAWTKQDRQNEAQNRELLVALSANQGIVGFPTDVGVKSSVGPGVACHAFAAGGYDCVLAYVDEADSFYRIQVRRFWYNWYAPGGAAPVWDPGVYMQITSTASAIGAFYHNGAYYLAVRPMTTDQNLVVLKSTDGATWNTDTTFPASYSVTGPVAVSYWTGNNSLFTVH